MEIKKTTRLISYPLRSRSVMRYLSVVIYFIPLSILTIILITGHVFAEPLFMPKELVDIAAEKGCRQLLDFYGRPGMVEPAFIYGYALGEKEDSAVFWCKAKPNTYKLIVWARSTRSKLPPCPDTIVWKNYPGGLSIVSPSDAKLDGFYFMDDPAALVPKGLTMTHNGILSSYDGVEELFYCLDGKWIVRQRH